MNILDKIALNKRAEVDQLMIEMPIEQVKDRLRDVPTISFKTALSNPDSINIIAELKKGSPSKGIMKPDFDPGALAAAYRDGGAAALSILTDSRFFYGSFENIALARHETSLPILCKDFILDPYQVYYARLMGADAVLLIVRLLGEMKLTRLLAVAAEIGMDCLVEVHDEKELQIAISAGADIVGVNNRNLSDFSVSLELSERLAAKIPPKVVKVAESGILDRGHVERLQASGYNNFLIGEALVTADDPTALLNSLRGEA